MAKKVKFPLDMGNEVYVRTLEELKENYNSEKVTEYFLDGRLLTWLNDRYFDDEAEQVQELMEQEDKNNLAAKLGKIFGIEIQDDVDVENLEIRREKLEKLRLITSDDNILDNADLAAFSQEELGDLLDNGAEIIYLCGEKFRIPLSVKNIRYIGLNAPIVTISGKGEIDLEANGIVFEDCEFSDDTKARFAIKEGNTVEHEDIVEYEDVVINKDPLHLKNGEAASSVINYFVDRYLNNPKPLTAEQMKEMCIEPLLGDRNEIVLTAEYLNFTYTEDALTKAVLSQNNHTTKVIAKYKHILDFAKNSLAKKYTPKIMMGRYELFRRNFEFAMVVPNQSMYAAEAIEQNGHILCYTNDNKEAFASGCLFKVGGVFPLIMGEPSNSSSIEIHIKAEKYTEFLEKFAVTSLIAVPCGENVSISTLERIISNSNPTIEDIMPLIYIDIGKVVDDMCKKLNKIVNSIEKGNNFYDFDDYCIKTYFSDHSTISDFKYFDLFYYYTAKEFEKSIV